MGIINDTITSILQIDKKNIKNFIIFIIILAILYPFIDSLIIKPLQIKQEIEILQKIDSIEKLSIDSAVEKKLYDDILIKTDSLINIETPTLNLIERYQEDPGKFYSGILIWVILLFILIFKKEKLLLKIATIITLFIIIMFIGTIGILIPTIISPWINYFLYPIIQIIFLISLLGVDFKKKK